MRWLLVVLAGCFDEPEVGPPSRPICENVDSDPDIAVSFELDLRAGIFEREDVHCTRCHTPTGETPIGLDVGGLDLSTFDTLRRGGVQSGEDIVRSGDPCGSILLQKVGTAAPFGVRMPLDGPPYLSARDQRLLADWISEGALAN